MATQACNPNSEGETDVRKKLAANLTQIASSRFSGRSCLKGVRQRRIEDLWPLHLCSSTCTRRNTHTHTPNIFKGGRTTERVANFIGELQKIHSHSKDNDPRFLSLSQFQDAERLTIPNLLLDV